MANDMVDELHLTPVFVVDQICAEVWPRDVFQAQAAKHVIKVLGRYCVIRLSATASRR